MPVVMSQWQSTGATVDHGEVSDPCGNALLASGPSGKQSWGPGGAGSWAFREATEGGRLTEEGLPRGGGGVLALAGKGVSEGMQLSCPKKHKERKACGRDSSLEQGWPAGSRPSWELRP